MAEALAIISLVGNVIQFVELGSEIINKATEFHQSRHGALAENLEIEDATDRLSKLSKALRVDATRANDTEIQALCLSAENTAEVLLTELKKVKANYAQPGQNAQPGKSGKLESLMLSFKAVFKRHKIQELEHQLDKIKADLNLHVTVEQRCV